MLSFDISQYDHCRRFESYLRTLMPAAPPGYARKLIKNGGAKLNGSTVSADTLLSIHDSVTLKESAATAAQLSSVRPELDILYEDNQILLANKPPGLPMHRTAEYEDNLVDVGQSYMTQRATPCKLYPVNRLDRGTSGAVILAKSSSSAAIYGRQVKEIGLVKLYLALVWGKPDSSGIVNEKLDGKESETRYQILLAGENCSLLAVTPISGRTHQIRRHLSLIGRPVIGDSRYGGGETPELAGFALHSFRTALVLPDSKTIAVCAPLPGEMVSLCERRGISYEILSKRLYRMAQDN